MRATILHGKNRREAFPNRFRPRSSRTLILNRNLNRPYHYWIFVLICALSGASLAGLWGGIAGLIVGMAIALLYLFRQLRDL